MQKFVPTHQSNDEGPLETVHSVLVTYLGDLQRNSQLNDEKQDYWSFQFYKESNTTTNEKRLQNKLCAFRSYSFATRENSLYKVILFKKLKTIIKSCAYWTLSIHYLQISKLFFRFSYALNSVNVWAKLVNW